MGLLRKSNKSNIKKNILEEKIDFNNIITSAFHAKELYDELKVKYHPDKYSDSEIKVKATKIFQRITENKENFEALVQLKELAEIELINT